jgi:hypothetical protein
MRGHQLQPVQGYVDILIGFNNPFLPPRRAGGVSPDGEGTERIARFRRISGGEGGGRVIGEQGFVMRIDERD